MIFENCLINNINRNHMDCNHWLNYSNILQGTINLVACAMLKMPHQRNLYKASPSARHQKSKQNRYGNPYEPWAMTICTVAHICTHWFKHSMKKNGSECSCSFSQIGGYDISRSCKMKNHLRPMNENKPCWKPWIICIRSTLSHSWWIYRNNEIWTLDISLL